MDGVQTMWCWVNQTAKKKFPQFVCQSVTALHDIASVAMTGSKTAMQLLTYICHCSQLNAESDENAWRVGGLACRLVELLLHSVTLKCVDNFNCWQFYSWLVYKMALYIFTVMYICYTYVSIYKSNKWILKSKRKCMGKNVELFCSNYICTVCMYKYIKLHDSIITELQTGGYICVYLYFHAQIAIQILFRICSTTRRKWKKLMFQMITQTEAIVRNSSFPTCSECV